MYKQFLILAVLLVSQSLADSGAEVDETDLLVGHQTDSPLNKLHTSLFYVAADPQEVEETLEQLKSARDVIATEGDHEGLFAEKQYNPELLIELYFPEETCNSDKSYDISQLIDYHRAKHGLSNIVEYLNFARRYQLAGCRVEEIQSRLGETIGKMDTNAQLELPSVDKFVVQLDSDSQEKIMDNDELPTSEVADLVVAYMKQSGKAPRFLARVLNQNHIESVINSTVDMLERIYSNYKVVFGHFSEVSKDSFVWNKLGAAEKNKILVGRLCELVANAGNLREKVDEKL